MSKKPKKVKPTSFTVTRKKIPVTLDNLNYEVRELGGEEYAAYMAAMAKRVVVGPDGKPTGALSDYTNVQSGLVAKCLYAGPAATSPVELSVINSWPSSTVKGLFELCQEVNGMEPEEEEELKKPSDPEGSITSGS